MTTYYGIEQSTDSRCPQTRVKRLSNRATAERYAAMGTRLTYADPDVARNWHHTFYSAWAMPSGWRAPSPTCLAAAAQRSSSRDYPRTSADVLALAIERDGERVRALGEAVK